MQRRVRGKESVGDKVRSGGETDFELVRKDELDSIAGKLGCSLYVKMGGIPIMTCHSCSPGTSWRHVGSSELSCPF
jgi:hypothetical protein